MSAGIPALGVMARIPGPAPGIAPALGGAPGPEQVRLGLVVDRVVVESTASAEQREADEVFGVTRAANQAGEAVGEDAAAQVRLELLVDVLGQAAAVAACFDQLRA